MDTIDKNLLKESKRQAYNERKYQYIKSYLKNKYNNDEEFRQKKCIENRVRCLNKMNEEERKKKLDWLRKRKPEILETYFSHGLIID